MEMRKHEMNSETKDSSLDTNRESRKGISTQESVHGICLLKEILSDTGINTKGHFLESLVTVSDVHRHPSCTGIEQGTFLDSRLFHFVPLSHSLSRNGNGITSPLEFVANEQMELWLDLW